MNKLHTIIFLSATLLGVSAPCMASESDSTKLTVAMLGSQSGHAVANDAALQKAIEALVKQQQQQQKQNVDLKKRLPNKLDNPIGEHPLRDSERTLILGGAEAMPM